MTSDYADLTGTKCCFIDFFSLFNHLNTTLPRSKRGTFTWWFVGFGLLKSNFIVFFK